MTRRRSNRRFLRSEEHTSELQSRPHLVCRLLLEKKIRLVVETWRGDWRACPVGTSSAGDLVLPAANRRIGPFPTCFAVPECRIEFFFFLNKRGPPEFRPFPHPAAFPF